MKIIKPITTKIITPDSIHFGRDPYSNDAIWKFKIATLIDRYFFCGQA